MQMQLQAVSHQTTQSAVSGLRGGARQYRNGCKAALRVCVLNGSEHRWRIRSPARARAKAKAMAKEDGALNRILLAVRRRRASANLLPLDRRT